MDYGLRSLNPPFLLASALFILRKPLKWILESGTHRKE
jgi:hypothetical protein